MPLSLDPLDSVSLNIKNTRTATGISQKRLAIITGLSQSTIARLETDIKRLNPSYDTIFRVSESLASLKKAESSELMNKTAKDIMHRDILFVKVEDTIEKAIKIIKDYDVPQLPVLNEARSVVGTVTQKKLLTMATERPYNISKMYIREIIEPSLPQVDKDIGLVKLKPILENFNAVIVVEKSRAIGIVTIYDILKLL